MKNRNYYLWAAAAMAFAFTSCSDDDGPGMPDPDYPTVSEGIYVLNQGQYYSGIEGSLNVLGYSAQQSLQDVFKTANGRSLGDTPQTGVAYGSKIYIGVCESNTVEIIRRSDYKTIKQIKLDGSNGIAGKQPRSMVSHNGKVYISMYDGYVARLDTLTLEIDKSVQVGPNPEIMALHNNKLYVPNSDGMNYAVSYGKTASEVDLATFTVTKTFEVPLNPYQFYSIDGRLFLLSKGDYASVMGALYEINGDYTNTKLCEATLAGAGRDCIYMVNDPFYGAGVAEYKQFNLADNQVTDWEITRPDYPNCIYYDNLSGNLMIASYIYDGPYPSFTLPGYVNVYTPDGSVKKYNVGVGPAWIFTNSK